MLARRSGSTPANGAARSTNLRARSADRRGPHCRSVARDAATVGACLSPRPASCSPHRVTRCASSPTISGALAPCDERAGFCAPKAHPAWPSSAASMFHVERLRLAQAVCDVHARHTATPRAQRAAVRRALCQSNTLFWAPPARRTARGFELHLLGPSAVVSGRGRAGQRRPGVRTAMQQCGALHGGARRSDHGRRRSRRHTHGGRAQHRTPRSEIAAWRRALTTGGSRADRRCVASVPRFDVPATVRRREFHRGLHSRSTLTRPHGTWGVEQYFALP